MKTLASNSKEEARLAVHTARQLARAAEERLERSFAALRDAQALKLPQGTPMPQVATLASSG